MAAFYPVTCEKTGISGTLHVSKGRAVTVISINGQAIHQDEIARRELFGCREACLRRTIRNVARAIAGDKRHRKAFSSKSLNNKFEQFKDYCRDHDQAMTK